ncbi:hypothetical protein Tco_1564246 [Tanacetum coccineum]
MKEASHLAIVYVKKESRKEKKEFDVELCTIGRKAHLLEDKQIPSARVFDQHLEEKHVTWARFRKKLDKNATFQDGDSHPDAFIKSA